MRTGTHTLLTAAACAFVIARTQVANALANAAPDVMLSGAGVVTVCERDADRRDVACLRIGDDPDGESFPTRRAAVEGTFADRPDPRRRAPPTR